MGLRDGDAGSRVSVAQFRDALRRLPVTAERRRVVRAYAAAPDGLTAHELGVRLGNRSTTAHSIGNLANSRFGKDLAKRLLLPLAPEGDGWWVGAAFRWHRDNPLGHLQLEFWPKLHRALQDVEPWAREWRIGIEQRRRMGPARNPVLDSPGRIATRIARDRQPAFRAAVLRAWGDQCALTGTSLAVVIDAAHLDRYADSRDDAPGNGIPLRADLHRLLDRGYLLVERRRGVLRTRLHPEVTEHGYRNLDGQRLRKPLDAAWALRDECLRALAATALRERRGWNRD